MRVAVLLAGLCIPFAAFAHSLNLHEEEMKAIIAGGDPAKCLTISESELISDCIVAFARVANDHSLCQTDPSPRSRAECTALILQDASSCDRLQGADREHCVTVMARSLKSPDLCESIDGAFAHDRCIVQAAGVIGDVSLCERIEDHASSTYALCISAVALERRDAAMCDSISSLSVKRECFRDIAEASGDSTICERIENRESGAYYGCLLRVGVVLRDPSVCEDLDNRERRSSCKGEVMGSLDPRLIDRPQSQRIDSTMVFAAGGVCTVGFAALLFVRRKKHLQERV